METHSHNIKTTIRSWNSRGAYRLICSAVMFVLLLGSAQATLAADQTKKHHEKQPHLIDRELFFGDPEISGAQLSPDGQFIAFIKPFKGTRNIWVKRTGEPFDAAKPITADTRRPIPGFFWSQDGKFILFVQDKGGDENFNIYAVDPAASPAQGAEVPAARNLTDLKGVRAFINAVPENDPDAIYVGLNDRDPAWHDLYKVKISTGERTLIRKNTERITGWVFDLKDQLRLATRSADNGDTEVLRVDANGFNKVYACGVTESCGPVRFHKDDKRVYMITNKGDNVDLIRLVLFDPETGKEELVEADPLHRVDLGGPIFSNVSDELVGTVYTDERNRVYWKDAKFEADYNFLKKHFGNKDIGFGSLTKDEQLALIVVSSDTEPGERYLFNRKTKELTLQYRTREKLDRHDLAHMKPIRYKSSDGLEIPAFLTLPKGVAHHNLPLIVFPHGGPWARDYWGFSSPIQFLANRGYAVLQVNFRASTGYGKKFLNAGNKQWGEKMQDDLTWGVKHLVDQGIVDSKRVAIMGGSYGGYATLAGLAFTPDVYACGVSIVGPSNLITLLNSIPPYWESIRKIFYDRMGDPNTPEGKAQLERQSPLNSANKMKAPLLVVQGANDPRVKKAESDQIVVALRERGFPVEYINAPDEGHGFQRPVNNMAMYASAEKFLAKHIGGRFQETMTDEVSNRLKEITVDIKSVTLPNKNVETASGTAKPVSDLKVGEYTYKANIAISCQQVALDMTSVVKEENGAWVITDVAKSPMIGEIRDVAVVEKGSLNLIKRTVNQGPVVIEVSFKDNKANGQMTFNGQTRPISADLGGSLFADGAGAALSIASLPLKEGYSTTFRNFDVQTNKVKVMQLKVVGVEKVTVPAGTFDAYKVEMTSAEGEPGSTTLWVSKDNHKAVKTSAVLPQLNGAVMTIELQQ